MVSEEALVPQLPHSYYFTTRTLVLKFVNKGVFLEEIQDSHFQRKRGYFGTHLDEFGEKGIIFDVQCFTVKRGFIWAKKSVFYRKKGVRFGLKNQCFITKKGSFWAEKSVFCCKKKGVIFKLENKDGYHFFQWVREPGLVHLILDMHVLPSCLNAIYISHYEFLDLNFTLRHGF